MNKELGEISQNQELYLLANRFGRFYGIAQKLREDLLINPHDKSPIWYPWLNDDGTNMKNEKGQNVGTPMDKRTAYEAVNKLAWKTYQRLEELGQADVCKDTIDFLQQLG